MMWENAWNSKTARAALCITHTPSKQMLISWSLLPFLAFFILENLSRICVHYFMARLLFYNTYIQIDPDKTNTIRDQNLFNRIKLNSWAGLVSVWVSPSDVPFVNRRQYETLKTYDTLRKLYSALSHSWLTPSTPIWFFQVFSKVKACSRKITRLQMCNSQSYTTCVNNSKSVFHSNEFLDALQWLYFIFQSLKASGKLPVYHSHSSDLRLCLYTFLCEPHLKMKWLQFLPCKMTVRIK